VVCGHLDTAHTQMVRVDCMIMNLLLMFLPVFGCVIAGWVWLIAAILRRHIPELREEYCDNAGNLFKLAFVLNVSVWLVQLLYW